ncbi:MAG: S-methyl-5-thioribose-1-phosphate isomerase [Burkholderiales bacterium]
MDSHWNDAEAAKFGGELALRAYTSRLLGAEKSLVLYGGGNTSVKIDELLYVKGTGSDLAHIGESGFAPLNLDCVRRLLERETLDNTNMMQALDACLARRPAPRPSIETLLHAALPFKYVEHTHAYSVLAVANVEDNERIVAGLYGELAPLVPYRHSGVELARKCEETLRLYGTSSTIGLILAFHGVIAFGNSARESYRNMIRLVTMAEDYLKAAGAWDIAATDVPAARDRDALAQLRMRASRVAGFPLVMRNMNDAISLAFARRPDLDRVSQQGPATPQHAIYTKRVPQLGRDVETFARHYGEYLGKNLGAAAQGRIDTAPRIVLDPELGICALGINADYAKRAAEVYRRDIEVISRASAHDAYRCAPEREIARAELEYGGFEAALRARAGSDKPLLGQIALVTTGAAHEDPALASRLATQGAAVVVADTSSAEAVLDQVCAEFGGLDLVYTTSAENVWREIAADLLRHSPVGGRIVTLGDKAVPPGPVSATRSAHTPSAFATLRWHHDALEMLDQRALPGQCVYLSFESAHTVADAIRNMVVRGAPAIGCAAAYGVALEALRLRHESQAVFDAGLERAFQVLAHSRPTAVNLFWALNRMRARLAALRGSGPERTAAALLAEAHLIHEEDIVLNRLLGQHGSALLHDGARVLTHCNAGALATAGHGTALGVIRSAIEAGKKISVIADETRPFLQGARLTAWELQQDSIPVTLIADNAAGLLMSRGEIDAVIVGADRVAANGDVANKIGTYGVAVLARRHAIPFYVACPLSTVDLSIASGQDIPIEERGAEEVTGHGGLRWAPEGVNVRNPVFDVTPAELVSALITERGIITAPDREKIAQLFRG